MARYRLPSLTDGEVRLMHVLWDRGSATVADVVEALSGPKATYSTVQTMLRILDETVPALPTEHRVAEHRKIVVPAQDIPAMRAVRRRLHNRTAVRQTMDADVEKATDDEPGQERDSDCPADHHDSPRRDCARPRPGSQEATPISPKASV